MAAHRQVEGSGSSDLTVYYFTLLYSSDLAAGVMRLASGQVHHTTSAEHADHDPALQDMVNFFRALGRSLAVCQQIMAMEC